ncbi:M20/M25/M40 family metallo-hydrolase [Mesorhizobium sp. M0768]|uniref:M20/M25/M40 family metallo-hydrolase n=1 Tax=Mesorhizobium sp. M0768 TaxID=2956996 RepID=UPI00333A22F7
MHTCGHDGHTAILLGTAKYLANTRNFKGSIALPCLALPCLALPFQPAEEDGQGAQRIAEEGIKERFGTSQVFSMHNQPGMEVGELGICDGAFTTISNSFKRGRDSVAYMLEVRRALTFFSATGATAGVHNAAYDFNDEALIYGG